MEAIVLPIPLQAASSPDWLPCPWPPLRPYSATWNRSYQGTVVFQAIVGADGRIRDLRPVRALGMGLDEKAMEAVRQWRFRPGMKEGKPVDVMASIEVTFRLL